MSFTFKHSPIWFSHRGFHKDHPENSILAFDAAIKMGFGGLETDLRTSKDGKIFLCHDLNLERVCGMNVDTSQCTWESLYEMKLQDSRSRLVRFEEFIDRYAAYSWIFDIKPETAEQVIESLASWCQMNNTLEWISQQAYFLTWNPKHEKILLKSFPKARRIARPNEAYWTGFWTLLGVKSLAHIQPNRVYGVPPSFWGLSLFRKDYIQSYQSQGGQVIAYLPNTNKEFAAARESGCDLILTDEDPSRVW